MTPIYLDHPVHGTHIVYTENDVKECAKNGWVQRTDEAPAKQELKKTVETGEIEALREQAKALGIVHHPKLGAAKLQALIEAKVKELEVDKAE